MRKMDFFDKYDVEKNIPARKKYGAYDKRFFNEMKMKYVPYAWTISDLLRWKAADNKTFST